MMDFVPYRHKVQYYETDGMRVVHHSNYIRFMEEARCDLMEQMGYSYSRLESMGIELDGEKVGNFITRFVSSIWDLIQSFLSE